MKETLNQRITYYRRLSGYTKANVADKMGMKRATYAKTERKGRIDCDFLIKISEISNIPTEHLLFGGEDPYFAKHAKVHLSLEERFFEAIMSMPAETRMEVYSFIDSECKKYRKSNR